MSQLIYSQILVDGKEVLKGSNYRIHLHQPMASHHKLTITCPTESLENILGNFATRAKNYIGSKITLTLGHAKFYGALDKEDLRFLGLITNVNINKYDGSDGLMTITAYSPTILLTHGKDSQSYERKTLPDIIKEATKEYPSDLIKFNLKPKYKNPIPYTVQYKENDFEFIQRLAARYGEWFYYDGQKIQFGQAGGGNTEVNYGVDLQSFDFKMQTRPQDHTFYAYDSLQATVHDSSMQDFKESVNNPFINHVTDVSKKMFTKKPKSIYNHSLMSNGVAELDEVARLKAGHAQNTVFFSGIGESAKVQLGDSLKVYGRNTLTKQKEFYGRYIITEISHSVDTAGEYENYFHGVPIDIKVPPYFNEDAVPMCEDQYGVVMDNNDPQGLSRVRVQFPWQKEKNELTPWMRVTTAYAGSEKGFHFVPETGEEVLVSFEGGCAEKPFMLASMYNEKEKSGYNVAGNQIKAIHTRSGHILKFTEDESIILTDKSGNELHFDTTGSNITISAPETMTLNCKNMNINVRQNLTTSVGQNQTTSVGQNITISAAMNYSESTGLVKSSTVGQDSNIMVMGSLMEFIQGDATSETGKGREEVASEVSFSSTNGNVNHHASKQVQNNSGEKGNNF